MSYTPHPDVHPDKWPALMRARDVGSGVAAWQATLEALGYDITDPAGEFGDTTHNATLAFQKLRIITIDGIVGNECKSNINSSLVQPGDRQRSEVDRDCLDNIAFVQAENFTKAKRGLEDVSWVVVHSMEGAEAATKAETVARWFAGKNPRFPAPRSSAHYAVDCDSIVQMVHESDVAWAAPGANKRGLHLEHAGKARQTTAQWRDAFSEPMLLQSSWLAARACIRYGLPVRFVDRDGLDRGDKGITTHNEVTRSNLSDRGSHTDPGPNFPMDWYLECVRSAFHALSATG